MGFYQVIALPTTKRSRSPCKPFIDRRLYTEISGADERLQELVNMYPEYELSIIVVSVKDRKEYKA